MVEKMGDQSKGEAISAPQDSKTMLYNVEETPPWYLCLLLGFQHCLLVFGSSISVPLVLSASFCMDQDKVGVSDLIGTTFFVTGLTTLLQTTIGVRLPLVQGCSASFLTQAITLMRRRECLYKESGILDNVTFNVTQNDVPEVGSDAHRDMWMARIREVQGAIIVASAFEIIVGLSGTLGFLLRFVGPLTIAPTLTLIGFSLFTTASEMASEHWWIALTTIFLFTLCSQYLRNVNIPCPKRSKICSAQKMPVFKLFPILIAIFGSWAICAALTAGSVLTDKPGEWGYAVRTDRGIDVLQNASWFRFPYPGQWGAPTVTTAGVLSMLIAVFATMIEAVGNFYACATIADAPPPPSNVLNRGLLLQGISCMLAGIWGTGNGTTTASDNLSIIGVTKVASLRVLQIGGLLLMIFGCFGKFSALFSTIPPPIIGGMLMVTFGIITAVGLSFLQFVDLNSFRNIFILGFSLFFGTGLSSWMLEHDDVIKTGNDFVDQVFTVLLSTSMFVGAMTGFILDNTIPGTPTERGIQSWRNCNSENTVYSEKANRLSIYELPLVTKCMKKCRLFRYIPFCYISTWSMVLPKRHSGNGLNNTGKIASKETVISIIDSVKL